MILGHASIVFEEQAHRQRGNRVNYEKGGKWKSKSAVLENLLCFAFAKLVVILCWCHWPRPLQTRLLQCYEAYLRNGKLGDTSLCAGRKDRADLEHHWHCLSYVRKKVRTSEFVKSK